MIWNLPPLPALPTDRFAMILFYVLRFVGVAHRPGTDMALVEAAYRRVDGLRRRFMSLVARWRAGTLRPPRPRGAARKAGAGRKPPSRLPRQPAWLCHMVPAWVSGCGGWLLALMDDPEMIALVRAAPQVGRILRPLFRMVGTQMPAILVLPPRAKTERAAGPAPAEDVVEVAAAAGPDGGGVGSAAACPDGAVAGGRRPSRPGAGVSFSRG